MHPKQVGPYNSEAEVHTISQVENPMSVPVGLPMGVPPGSNNGNIPPGLGMNEDSNHSGKDLPGAGSNVELAFRYCIYNFSKTVYLEKPNKITRQSTFHNYVMLQLRWRIKWCELQRRI